MTEAILFALWVGTALFFTCREIKAKNDRESYEWWLSELRECIHSIERHFSRECEKIITEAFSGRNVKGGVVVGKYWEEITALKNEYANNLYEKIVAQKGKYGIKSVPEYLENEYKRNISDIADTYRGFGDFITEQIKEISKEEITWKIY